MVLQYVKFNCGAESTQNESPEEIERDFAFLSIQCYCIFEIRYSFQLLVVHFSCFITLGFVLDHYVRVSIEKKIVNTFGFQ